MLKFTAETQQTIRRTANYLAADAEELGVRSKSGLAELVLDANRTAMFSKQADAEIINLIKLHGWKPVKTAAAKLL